MSQQVLNGTWTAQQVPDVSKALSSVSCANETTCVAVGQFGLPVLINEVTVVATTDGGTTWQNNVEPPVPAGVPGTAVLTVGDIACPSATRCFIAESFSFSSTGVGQIAVTTDLGLTWQAQTLPTGTTSIDALACPSSTICYASVQSNSSTQVIGTVDGGQTWAAQAPVSYAGHLSCVSTTECYSIADNGVTYATTDGGAHWAPRTMVPWLNIALLGGVTDASCPSSGICYVVGVGVGLDFNWPFTYKTTDGGVTWTILASPGPAPGATASFGLSTISCPSSTICYTRGRGTFIPPMNGVYDGPIGAVTLDGGANWARQRDVVGSVVTNGIADAYATSLDCPNIDKCFAVGQVGVAHYAMNTPASFAVMAATPDGQGYWIASPDGTIYSYGEATFYGSMGGLPLTQPIVGMASTPDGKGYWLVAGDGGIFSFGDARFFGSTGAMTLNQPIVGMTATADGGGYWLVASDGGIFAFDAPFLGSTGNIVLHQPVVGMQADPVGTGYRFVASDGGVFCFGLPYSGSMGGRPLNQPVVGMATSGTTGYWLVASDGGIFSFGGAPFLGSPA
jgi:photosystem II stability/assembly factor-like uncharacterized protein